MPENKLSKQMKGYMQDLEKLFSKLSGSFKKTKYPKFTKKIINGKRFLISLCLVVIVSIISLYIYYSGTAYAVMVNGVEVGKIKDEKLIEDTRLKLKEHYQKVSNGDVELTADITLEKTRAGSKEILDKEQLLQAFKTQINYKVEAYSILVNGSSIAILKNKADAEYILDEVKQHFLEGIDTEKLKEISFHENVEIIKEFEDTNTLMDKNELIPFIIKGTNEEKIHEVESGESFWSISRKYNMSVDELQNANPDIKPNRLQIGHKLSLIVPKPLISVKTVETITYSEKIPFEQNVEFSESLYKDETRIRVKGEYGEEEVVADLIKVNGIEEDREIITQTEVKAPKTQILVKGTKAIPPKKGTGTFSTPTRGRLTSSFGLRWGRRHEGIDLAAPTGTTVTAADGGVITWVGTNGGYGKLIKVDHGGNFVTFYGHLSKYYVKVGDKVYKGQKIGAVGNTGRSTGPHLHFEIRKNGVAQDPYRYIKR